MNKAACNSIIEIEKVFPNRKIISVPIDTLSSYGEELKSLGNSLLPFSAIASSIDPAMRTVASTTTINMQGLYTLANADVGDVLQVAKNGNFWATLRTANGAPKFVQLKPAGPIDLSTVTTLPINPAMMVMAVAIHSIDNKLDNISKTTQQIFEFLNCEKETEIESDYKFLLNAISKYKYNWDNEQYINSYHNKVVDIKEKATDNISFYQKKISAIQVKKPLFVKQSFVRKTLDELKNIFTFYIMALDTYSIASLFEIILSHNFEENNIKNEMKDIQQEYLDYLFLHDNYQKLLENLCQDATKNLNNLSSYVQSEGQRIGNKKFIVAGENTSDMINNFKEDVLNDFAKLSNTSTMMVVEKMEDLNQIYNHTENICFDSERIYLVGESVESEETTEAEQKEEE